MSHNPEGISMDLHGNLTYDDDAPEGCPECGGRLCCDEFCGCADCDRGRDFRRPSEGTEQLMNPKGDD